MSSASELEMLGHLIKRAQHRHHRALDRRLSHLGISLVQWNALREIERHPGSSQNQLADLTFNSAQAFGTLTTRLIRLGFVERHPGEGRATVHQLTRKGKTLLDRGQEIAAGVLADSFSALTEPDRSKLLALLGKVMSSGDEL